MFQFVQDMMIIVFGLVLILLLLFALKYVHVQAQKVKALEKQLNILESTETIELANNQEEK